MIHNLKPYPAYKDSGVSWLGEVPAHWEGPTLKLLLFETEADTRGKGERRCIGVTTVTSIDRANSGYGGRSFPANVTAPASSTTLSEYDLPSHERAVLSHNQVDLPETLGDIY